MVALIMIAYLEGRIIHAEADRILLKAGHVGYEVVISSHVHDIIKRDFGTEDDVSLYIYYHQTERQPKPVLIGFLSLMDKAFFQQFITVDAIGPLKAVKALGKPASEVAAAIETKNVAFLSSLSGIGARSAEKIIAQLKGKVGAFLDTSAQPAAAEASAQDRVPPEIFTQVFDVLVEQLGHAPAQARQMIELAGRRNQAVSTPEELFDLIFLEKDV